MSELKIFNTYVIVWHIKTRESKHSKTTWYNTECKQIETGLYKLRKAS